MYHRMKSCGILSFPFFHFSFLEKISSFAVTVDGFMGKEFPLPTYVYEDMAGQNAYIKERTEAGFLCCYNHPYWSLQNYDDYKDFEGLWAMEIYNHGCEHDGLYGFNPQSYDEMLRSGQKLFTVATDDNHNIFPVTDPMCDSFGGFIQITAS